MLTRTEYFSFRGVPPLTVSCGLENVRFDPELIKLNLVARFSTYIVPILEVEAALVSLPYIAEGYILPVPDDMHGHLIGALVRLKPETCLDMLPLTLATLRSDLSLSISLYKQPTLLRVVVDEEIPLSGQGKLARNKAIEMYFTSSTGLCYLQKWDLTLEMRRPGKKAWDWGGITL